MASGRLTKSGTWEFIIKRKNLLPRPISLRFSTKEEGERYCAQAEALFDRGIIPPGFLERVKRADTLQTAISDYLVAVSVKKEDVELLGLWAKECPPNLGLFSIDFRWCQDQLIRLKQQRNLAPGTIRKRVGALSRCLSWHVALGHMNANPLSSLPKGYAQYTIADDVVLQLSGRVKKIDEHRSRRLSPQEELAILQILDQRFLKARDPAAQLECSALKTLFILALETAMRLSEMVGLRQSQVDLSKRTISLETSKNGAPRQIPLSRAALAALNLYSALYSQINKSCTQKNLFFPWYELYTLDKKGLELASAAIGRKLITVFEKAGARDLVFHDLRHEGTSRLHEKTTLTITEIMSITGHKTHAMMLRYTHLRGSDLVDKML